MSWLLWRQHRSQTLVTAVVLALFGVVVWITGVHMAHEYRTALRTCTGNGTCDFLNGLFNGDGAIIDTVHMSIALPIVLGVFLGAPLIARETEHATNVLVWTQTVTRRHWLYTKVLAVLVGALLTSAAVSALVTWWSGTPNSLGGNRFEGAQFDTQNVVPIAFALFAVALGLAAGALFRRTLPALAATVGIFAAVRVLVAVYLRPHYMPAITRSFSVKGGDLPSGSWRMSDHLVDPAGHVIGGGPLALPKACNAAGRSGALQCLDRLGYHTIVKYQPPSHYWHFQWTEAGIFVLLAVPLVAFALVRTLRHDA